MAQGLMSLIPVTVVLGTALVTKRNFDSILYGAITGFILIGEGDLLESLKLLSNELYKAMSDATVIWIISIVVLFGGWAAIMEGSGGVRGISTIAEKLIKTRKTALLGVWILGVLFFFDDYLNVFAVSSIMKRITDKFKISRELLAFIINSSGVAICTIIPFSSWWVFMLVPLLAMGALPLFGPMKESESRAMEASSESREELQPPPKYMVVDFVVPVVLLAAVTVAFRNLLIGIFAALLLCFCRLLFLS